MVFVILPVTFYSTVLHTSKLKLMLLVGCHQSLLEFATNIMAILQGWRVEEIFQC